jgi:Right handed beta helix region
MNLEGIIIQSADPKIIKNTIDKNFGDGIIVETYEGIRCDGLIEKNDVTTNKKNGIYIHGGNNFVKINGNIKICYNRLAGIKVETHAHPSILQNGISKNLGQVIFK